MCSRPPTRPPLQWWVFDILKSFGLASDIEVVPTSHNRELTLCEKIEETGTEEQNKTRRILRIPHVIDEDKLLFFPKADDSFSIRATTVYPLVGEESVSFNINAKIFKEELSQSRPYAKHVPNWAPRWVAKIGASLAYPSFGLSQGFSESTVFFPPENLKEWRRKEIYRAEIARHSIVDRLGALALMSGRWKGLTVTTRYSGHKSDIEILRNCVKLTLQTDYKRIPRRSIRESKISFSP